MRALVRLPKGGRSAARGRRIASRVVVLVGAQVLVAASAAAGQVRLERFTASTGSQTALVRATQPRSGAIGGTLPLQTSVGASQVEVSSVPRAQANGAVVSVQGPSADPEPGQCRASYPGGPAEDTCGLPTGLSSAPVGLSDHETLDARLATVRVQASGNDDRPQDTRADSSAETAALHLGALLDLGAVTSQSRSWIDSDAVHATTSTLATDLTVGEVLHIGLLRTTAEVVHPGDVQAGRANAHTDILGASIAGVAVDLGPQGLLIEGRPVPRAAMAPARAVADALSAHHLSIHPVRAPALVTDPAAGVIAASSAGLEVALSTPDGQQVDLLLGQAYAYVQATPLLQAPPPAPQLRPPPVPAPPPSRILLVPPQPPSPTRPAPRIAPPPPLLLPRALPAPQPLAAPPPPVPLRRPLLRATGGRPPIASPPRVSPRAAVVVFLTVFGLGRALSHRRGH